MGGVRLEGNGDGVDCHFSVRKGIRCPTASKLPEQTRHVGIDEQPRTPVTLLKKDQGQKTMKMRGWNYGK